MSDNRRKLSDTWIAGLKPAPPGKRRDVYDNQVPGLLVRLTDAGSKSLMFYAKWPGKAHFERRLIGKHPHVTIEQARETARVWQDQLRNGHDPRVVADEQRLAALRAHQHTFAQVADDYIAYIHSEGQRKARVVERELRSVFVAAWGERPIAALTLHDVRAVITPVVRRGARYHAHTLFGHVRTLFRWAIGTGAYGLTHSPCDHLQPRQLIGKKASRRRVLDDDEIRALWAASGRLGDPRLDGYPWQPLFRLLLLTGQRKTEISDMQWPELDLGQRLLTIRRGQVQESAAVHLVPLSGAAIDIVEALPPAQISERRVRVFDHRRRQAGRWILQGQGAARCVDVGGAAPAARRGGRAGAVDHSRSATNGAGRGWPGWARPRWWPSASSAIVRATRCSRFIIATNTSTSDGRRWRRGRRRCTRS